VKSSSSRSKELDATGKERSATRRDQQKAKGLTCVLFLV
jgi:hypothetical protein